MYERTYNNCTYTTLRTASLTLWQRQHQTIVLVVEADLVQVGGGLTHPGRGQDLLEAVVGEDVAAPVDELARGEVAVLRQHIVEVDLRPATACIVGQHHADGLLAALHKER